LAASATRAPLALGGAALGETALALTGAGVPVLLSGAAALLALGAALVVPWRRNKNA
jgi:hypothetical protein